MRRRIFLIEETVNATNSYYQYYAATSALVKCVTRRGNTTCVRASKENACNLLRLFCKHINFESIKANLQLAGDFLQFTWVIPFDWNLIASPY